MKNRLQVAAQGDREIVMTREFDAPRELVFEAHVVPELIRQWLGVVNDWTMTECEVDLRVGGAYRYKWRNSKGAPMGMRGVFETVEEPAKLVYTERFDQSWYPGEALNTLELTELAGGRTRLVATTRYVSRDARDGVLRSPMAVGVGVSYDKLEALAAARER